MKMKTSIIFFSFLSLVLSLDDTEIKLNYYENLIKDAIMKAQNYNLPKDNSAHFKNVSKDTKEFGTFDFIIVGAGSSGSVVASRLSEVEDFNILLLEAGGWDDDLTDIPYPSLILQLSDRNWGYYTVPQKNGCYGWKGRQCAYATGKLIGGSGSIGQLAYVRGNKADYDGWSSMGNQGWSFEEVLPYFKKLENFDSDYIDLNYRGFAGPVNVEYGNVKEHFDILSDPLIEIGMGVGEDYNGDKQIGSFRNQINTKYARRVSGATAYIRPSLTRHNFNVTLRALVTKILINELSRTAYGVEFIQNGQNFRAIAKKEVILSAGGINTPQLLMLSGIGPTDELGKHSIPIIANLPVGKQLKDHYLAFVSYKNSRPKHIISLRNALLEYLNGTGILGRPTNALGHTFVNTGDASSPVPNIEYIYYLPFKLCYPLPFQSNFTDEAQEYMKELSHYFNIAVLLLHPKSTGTLKLRSKSMVDFPLIDIAMFENKEDLNTFYEGIKLMSGIGKTKMAKDDRAKPVKLPLCKQYSYNSKEYWFCALRYLTFSGLHVSSTAKMAPIIDPFAVVDNQLRVYTIKGLRVADCSIMPTQISGHNNAAAFMIGEKAAAMIKKDHNV